MLQNASDVCLHAANVSQKIVCSERQCQYCVSIPLPLTVMMQARSAHYNRACAHVKLSNWKDAGEDIKAAINDYNLKLIVAYKVWNAAMSCCSLLVQSCPWHCAVVGVSCAMQCSRAQRLRQCIAIATRSLPVTGRC